MSSIGTSFLAFNHFASAANVASRTSLSPLASCRANGFAPFDDDDAPAPPPPSFGSLGTYGVARFGLLISGAGPGNFFAVPDMFRSCWTCDLTRIFPIATSATATATRSIGGGRRMRDRSTARRERRARSTTRERCAPPRDARLSPLRRRRTRAGTTRGRLAPRGSRARAMWRTAMHSFAAAVAHFSSAH
eukprot:31232-Pelagococcus_subviridis.AAC.14